MHQFYIGKSQGELNVVSENKEDSVERKFTLGPSVESCIGESYDTLHVDSSELDMSFHYMKDIGTKGKGLQASVTDIHIAPKQFADGCKLLQAAATGDIDYIRRKLSKNPVDIHFRDYDRRTILHIAASEGKLDIVAMLIENFNANVNRSDRWGGSPLDDAHRHRHGDVVKYLLSKGASTGSTDQAVNLITAAAAGDLNELQIILSGASSMTTATPEVVDDITSTIDINTSDYNGRTALHLAAAGGHENALIFLISKGANVNAADNWGGTPLDDAVRTEMVHCQSRLKEYGAKVGKGRRSLEDKQKSREDMNLNVDFSDLEVIDKIGSGAFGVIYKCRWRGTQVAAKCIKTRKIVQIWRNNVTTRSIRDVTLDNAGALNEDGALRDFRLEISILKTLRHPNICMFLGYSQTKNFEVMISELMKCSLQDIFTSHVIHYTDLPVRTQLLYAQQLSKGMNYLHTCKPPIIHRDLKPDNILIDFSGTLKITDFGLAKVRPDPKTNETKGFRMTGETGSYRYMAPEVFRHENYNESVDIYSFAMIFYHLVSGWPPWEDLSGREAVIKAASEAADRPPINKAWDDQISSLMQRCWDENKYSRPPFHVITDELNEYSKTVHNIDMENSSYLDEGGRSKSKCNCVIS